MCEVLPSIENVPFLMLRYRVSKPTLQEWKGNPYRLAYRPTTGPKYV